MITKPTRAYLVLYKIRGKIQLWTSPDKSMPLSNLGASENVNESKVERKCTFHFHDFLQIY